jgi:hypothetical protein
MLATMSLTLFLRRAPASSLHISGQRFDLILPDFRLIRIQKRNNVMLRSLSHTTMGLNGMRLGCEAFLLKLNRSSPRTPRRAQTVVPDSDRSDDQPDSS